MPGEEKGGDRRLLSPGGIGRKSADSPPFDEARRDETGFESALKKTRRNFSDQRRRRAETRAPYDSDLSDEEWKLVAPLFHKQKKDGRGRPRGTPIREVLNALFYLTRTGCQWRMMPHDLPEWHYVYTWFRRWCDDGILTELNRLLVREIRVVEERPPDPGVGIIDSPSVKSTETAGVRGFDGGKKVKGVKRHIVIDTLGLLLTVVVHSAGLHDNQGAFLVLAPMFPLSFPRMAKIVADGGYGVHGTVLANWLLSAKGWVLEIVRRLADSGFKVLPQRWKVERTLAWLGRYRRLSRHYEPLSRTAERMVYVCSVRGMLRRLTCGQYDFAHDAYTDAS